MTIVRNQCNVDQTDRLDTIHRMLNEGHGVRVIAAHLNITVPGLRRWCRNNGYHQLSDTLSLAGQPPTEQHKQAARRALEIARETKTTRQESGPEYRAYIVGETVHLLRCGESVAQTANRLKLKTGTVAKHLREAGRLDLAALFEAEKYWDLHRWGRDE